MSRGWAALLVGVAALVAASFCVVVIDEREQGFRTVLGDPEPEILGWSFNQPVLREPGLALRIPFLHEIDIYDKRLLLYDAEPKELLLADKLAIEVDYYLTYRIEDPRLFREMIRTLPRLYQQLDDVSFSQVRNVLGQRQIRDLLSEQRLEIMREITDGCAAEMRPRGVEVADLRIRRTEYPEANLDRVFDRMRKEREVEAKRNRAEGEEAARGIRSDADRQSRVLVADARRKAAELRGEGDSQAARIYAGAYERDPEFYAFLRSLEAYRLALDQQTTVILSPNVPFLRHLFDDATQPATPPESP